METVESLKALQEIVSTLGGAGTLAAFFILYKLGFFKRNGNGNGNGAAIDKLSSYYNHDLTNKLEHIESLQQNQCRKLDKMVEHLEDIRISGVRIRKD